MKCNGKFSYIFLLGACLLALSGCAELFGYSSSNGEPYYIAEFEDIPIPSELGGIKETTIITTPGGVKTGLQIYKGRVEVGSLNSAMVGYMQREGWELRSSTRGARSLLLFEKEDRYCTIYILDGFLNTEMQVYVSPKLSNMSGVRQAPRPTIPTNRTPSKQGSGSGASAGQTGAAAPASGTSPKAPSSSFESQTLSE